MKIATIVLAGTTALAIISSATAQEARKGVIAALNRLNGTIAIQETQSGTVGANAANATEQFKVQNGLSLDDWHAGDMVTFSASGSGSAKTITKLEKQ